MGELIMFLMRMFPDTIQQYGIPLTERLVDSEKRDDSGVLNDCRKLLVRKALPIICKCPNVDISHRQYFKFMQKSTEYYACSFTSENDCTVDTNWEDLESLRQSVADRCGWDTSLHGAKESTTSQRMAFIRELNRKVSSDADEKVNKKQIFYTTIILLLEAASKYIQLLDPSIFKDSERNEENSFIFLDDHNTHDHTSSNMLHNAKLGSEINTYFQIAKESWIILHSNDTFDKDFNHLMRRWRCERWFWLQLFLVDMDVLDSGNPDEALQRLQNVEAKLNDTSVRSSVERHIYCRLASVMYNQSQFELASSFAFRCLPLVRDLTGKTSPSSYPLKKSDGTCAKNMSLMQLSIGNLLPLFINILIKSLQSLQSSRDDVLGHMLVLGQHDWPTWKAQVDSALERIQNKTAFEYNNFHNFVINLNILEEIAFVNNKGGTKLILSTVKAEVTQDSMWHLLEGNIQRSEEPVDSVILKFLSTCEESIMASLNGNND